MIFPSRRARARTNPGELESWRGMDSKGYGSGTREGSDRLSCHNAFECGEYGLAFEKMGEEAMGELEGEREEEERRDVDVLRRIEF